MIRAWTPTEIQTLRDRYGKVKASVIAVQLNRTTSSICNKAQHMGLAFNRCAELGPEFEKFLRQKHAKGWSDQDIADAWFADRNTVSKARKRLGLPCNSFNARHKAKLAKCTKRMLAGMGVKNMGHLRTRVWRLENAKRGWVGITSPRLADILDCLVSGPKTRREICAMLGEPWRGCKSLRNHKGTSRMAELIREGFVRVVKVNGLIKTYALAEGVACKKLQNAPMPREVAA